MPTMPRAVRAAYYATKSRVVSRVRAGGRSVVWTPQVGIGAGNQMYLWLDAYLRRLSGEDCRVLATPGLAEWRATFPRLEEIVVDRSEVGFRDHREALDEPWLRQRVGRDFTPEQLAEFVGWALLPRLAEPHGRTVVNVRRGDFYDQYLEKYGFDVEGYLAEALPAEPGPVVVVSDDVAWCRSRLMPVLGGAESVTFAESGPVSQFNLLAGAGRLVVTNSTFGYWGGYCASQRGATVTAPWLHARGINDGAAYQLLPSWTVVGPGDWDGVPERGCGSGARHP